MKRYVLLMVAVTFSCPFMLRSQQEGGVKNAPGSQSVDNRTQYVRVTQELAPLQEPAKPGGKASEAYYYSEVGMYMEPGWVNGYVTLLDHSVMEDIMLRYDIYHQQLQFILDQDTLAFSNPAELLEAVLDGKKFIFADYQADGVIGQSYFEVITDGDCQLLIRRKVKYLIKSEIRPAMEEDLYVRESEYLVRRKNEFAKPIRACRKSVLCAFSDREDEIKGFMRENRLKMKTCDELQQVVLYYNKLNDQSW